MNQPVPQSNRSSPERPIGLLLLGGKGRMGRSIAELAEQDARFRLVATPDRDDPLGADTPAFDVAMAPRRPVGPGMAPDQPGVRRP